MKAFLIFAMIAALAAAGGYLKSSDIADSLIEAYDAKILNNPHNIMAVVAGMPMAWFFCTWSMIFGADYKSCVYTHMYYALGN